MLNDNHSLTIKECSRYAQIFICELILQNFLYNLTILVMEEGKRKDQGTTFLRWCGGSKIKYLHQGLAWWSACRASTKTSAT